MAIIKSKLKSSKLNFKFCSLNFSLNRNKKGVFFTLIAILIVATLFVWFNNQQNYSNMDSLETTKDRVTRIDKLVEDVNSQYLERISRSVTYNALNALTLYVKTTKQPLDKQSFECALQTVPVYGRFLNLSWSNSLPDINFKVDPAIINPNDDLSVDWYSIGGNYILARKFTPIASGNLNSLTITARWNSIQSGDLIVEIRKAECGVPGPIIVSQSIIQAFGDTEWHDLEFLFDNNAYLENSKSYFFVFYSVNSEDNSVDIIQSNKDPIDGFVILKDNPFFDLDMDTLLPYNVINGNYLTNRLSQFSNLSNLVYMVNSNFTINNFSIFQDLDSGPWDLVVSLNVNYTFNASIASWQSNKTMQTKVNILGLEDPYISLETNNQFGNNITNIINDTTTDQLSNKHLWNITYLGYMIDSHAYRFEENAPSYLMRFTTNIAPSSCCGIESIVYLQNQDVNMSYIDYCFWSGTCPGSNVNENISLYNVTGITTNTFRFLLEPMHGQRYNVTEYMNFSTNLSTGSP